VGGEVLLASAIDEVELELELVLAEELVEDSDAVDELVPPNPVEFPSLRIA